MADIRSTSTLDNAPFSRALQDTLSQARRWKSDMERALNFDPLKKSADSLNRLQKSLAGLTVDVKAQPVRDLDAEVQKLSDSLEQTEVAAQNIDAVADAADRAAAAVGKTGASAKQAAQDFDAVETELRDAMEALQQFALGGSATEEAFENARQKALQLLATTSQLATDGGMTEYATNLNHLREQLEGVTFAQVKATESVRSGKRELTEVEQAVLFYRNATLSLRNEIEASVISQEEGIETARRLRDESLAAAQGAERWSKEYRELLVASGRADRTLATLEGRLTKLGMSQQVALGTTQSLTSAYQQLAGAVTGALAALGLTRYIQTLVNLSGEAAVARNTLSLFYTQMQVSGVPVARAQQLLAMLAAQFQTTEDAIAGSVTQLVRYGATMDQAVHILQRGGASALAAGKTAAQGFDAVTQAIVGEISQALNRIGIAGNLSTAYRQYARDLGTTSEALSNQQKIQAFLNITLRETDTEYAALGQTLAGFVGAQNRVNTAWTEFRRSVGRGAEQALGPLFNLATGLLNVFNRLPAGMQTLLTTTGLLAVTVTGVVAAYAVLQATLGKLQIAQTAMNGLLRNETILRSGLGGTLLTLAGRYKLLTTEQLANTTATRASLGPTTLLSGLLRGLGTAATTAGRGLLGLTRASLAFLATPVGAALAIIAGAVAFLTTAIQRHRAIVQPAVDAVSAAFGRFRDTLVIIRPAMQLFLDAAQAVASWLGSAMIVVAREVGLAFARLGRSIDQVAATWTYFQSILSGGSWRGAWVGLQLDLQLAEERFSALTAEIRGNADTAWAGRGAASSLGDTLLDLGGDAEDAADKLKAAQAALAGFEKQLRDIRIGLLPSGIAQDLARTAASFLDFRTAVAKAAEDMPEFAPMAAGLIAESFELEQQAILQIQEDYAKRRREEAEKQAKELADTIQERERAIVDAQTRGQLNQAQALTLEYRRRIQDTEAMYAGLIARAKEYGQDTTTLEKLRVDELLAIQGGYERDVQKVYDDLYQQIEERQRGLVRAAAEARGDEGSILGLDFDAELRSIAAFYDNARKEAAHNAALLADLEGRELNERLQAREDYWRQVNRLTEERGRTLADLEEDLAKQRAQLGGDAATIARVEAAAEVRSIQDKYDELEKRFAGHTAELARIAELRNEHLALANERLANSMQDIADEAFAESLSPAIDKLTEGLDNASTETLGAIRTQLQSWRQAYGSNGEVVRLVDAGLSAVESRFRSLADEAQKHVEDVIKTATALSEGIATQEARRGLSELESMLADSADEARQIREEQERIASALLTAAGAERANLVRLNAQLNEDMGVVMRNTMADAQAITRQAITAYQDGLEAAQRDISASAAQLLQADVDRVLRRISDVQTNALNEARTNLVRQIANLQAVGFDQASLAPLREQLAQLDAVLARSARSMAEFASAQHQNLREVAQAVLSTDQAEKVANQTYMESIRLRRAAVIEAREQGAAVEEVAQVTQALTQAQLQYIASLQGQVSRLQALKGEYSGIYGTVSDLADLLGRAIPPEVLEAQERLALSLLDGVHAAQLAGQTFDEYGDNLRAATDAWGAYESASRQALQQELADIEAITKSGVIPTTRMREMAERIAEQFEVPVREAFDRIRAFTKGELEDPFGDIDFRRPDVLSDIFENLNVEATKTPEVLAQIDDEIGRLEAKVESLKQLIAFDLDFESVGQQLVSGYSDVLDQIEGLTGEAFTEAAGQAVQAFTTRFAEARQTLQEELESQLGSASEAAGLTAGEGFINAFTTGIRTNADRLLAEVDRILQEIRNRLPSSDAKIGPLSDLTASGRTFFKTWMGGVQDGHARALRSMDSMLGKLTPNAAFTLAGASAGGGGGVGSAPINVNVDGRPVAPAPGPLALSARSLAREAVREIKTQGLLKKRR